MALKTVICGTGGIAAAHAQAVRASERVELAGCCDVDAARAAAFAQQHGIPAHYNDLAAMLKAVQPDLVQICTPPSAHTTQVIASLEAGAHVWCEKPLCGSLADVDRIAQAEARTGKTVTTVFQWRSGAMGKHVKRLIDEGALGRPLIGLCQTLWYRDAAYYEVDWRGRWDNELGGVTLGHGIHLIDLFLWLYGDWREVSAHAVTLDHAIQVDDVSMALVQFENGALGSIVNSVVSPHQETRLRLDFQRATVEVAALYHYENADWRFSTFDKSPFADLVSAWSQPNAVTPSGHNAAFADVIDSLERGERPALSGLESRRALEFITALYKSALTGQIVRRGSVTPDDPFYHALNGTAGQL
ncbi:MAG: Gfo/Idh/MocA family oxidoreductase [bacterium]|nr:Gfo/Idh/MocA family oxidoreductase [bacterium]